MADTVHRPGLDAQGHIRRESSLARVPPAFRPVVSAARERPADTFGTRLNGAYLYGSVPRGTAHAGRSDLDLLVTLHGDPTARDRNATRTLEERLDDEFPEVDGVGTLLYARERVLSGPERHDLGWFVSCLCTPLSGEDLAALLPRYRPARPTAIWRCCSPDGVSGSPRPTVRRRHGGLSSASCPVTSCAPVSPS